MINLQNSLKNISKAIKVDPNCFCVTDLCVMYFKFTSYAIVAAKKYFYDYAIMLKHSIRMIVLFYCDLGLIVSMREESWNYISFSKHFIKSCEIRITRIEVKHENEFIGMTYMSLVGTLYDHYTIPLHFEMLRQKVILN